MLSKILSDAKKHLFLFFGVPPHVCHRGHTVFRVFAANENTLNVIGVTLFKNALKKRNFKSYSKPAD
jgi:hypothetical protein